MIEAVPCSCYNFHSSNMSRALLKIYLVSVPRLMGIEQKKMEIGEFTDIRGNKLLVYYQGRSMVHKKLICKKIKKYLPQHSFRNLEKTPSRIYYVYWKKDKEILSISNRHQFSLKVLESLSKKEINKVLPNLHTITEISVVAKNELKGVEYFFLKSKVKRKLKIINVTKWFIINKAFRIRNLTWIHLTQDSKTEIAVKSTLFRQLKYFPCLTHITRSVNTDSLLGPNNFSFTAIFNCPRPWDDNFLQLLGLDWNSKVIAVYEITLHDKQFVKYVFNKLLRIKGINFLNISCPSVYNEALIKDISLNLH